MLVRVAVFSPLRHTFDYIWPSHISIQPTLGLRVRVPFGKQVLTGIIAETGITSDIPEKLKPINAVLDTAPLLTGSILNLCTWSSQYYHHSLGDVFSHALPILLRQDTQPYLPTQRFIYLTCKPDTCAQIRAKLGRAQKQLVVLNALEAKGAFTPASALALDPFLISSGAATSHIKPLVDKGFAIIETRSPDVYAPPSSFMSPLALNDEQTIAVERIVLQQHEFASFLIYGITGSGKTEVYMQLIAKTLLENKQVLMMIPEINLTPQTVSRLKARFKCPVVVFHSGLSDLKRMQAWEMARQGIAPIILGTRSAIFTPLARPGLIIIDEEHDLSFKQQEGFRYHARDIAHVRAQSENIPIILGTATPSLESLHRVQQKKTTLITLSQRAGSATLPTFSIQNIRGQHLTHSMTDESIAMIEAHLQNKKQVLVFLNRRGFSPSLQCQTCGWISECDNCDAMLTVHHVPHATTQHSHYLHCHHCDLRTGVPPFCPICHSDQLQAEGVGTKRLESTLQARFPKTPVIRIDRDSAQSPSKLEALLAQVNEGQACILVGTQMLAKGHHFPAVTLAIILQADLGFFSADFRGLERMGQLLLQVGGRAGRGEHAGHVVVQTMYPEDKHLHTLFYQDYLAFAKLILAERKTQQLPPYTHQMVIRANAKLIDIPAQFLQQLRDWVAHIVQTHDLNITLLGPFPATMHRRGDRYHYLFAFTCPHRKVIQGLAANIVNHIQSQQLAPSTMRWSIDIDPLETSS